MLKVIAAVAANGVIGKGNDLPWHLQDDLKRFKEVTMGHTVAMGQRTFRSILSRLNGPLPGRRNLVLTHSVIDTDSVHYSGFDFIGWWQTIVKRSEREDLFVIGGAMLYEQLLPFAQELYLTKVHADVDGNVQFPEWNPIEWERIAHEPHTKNAGNQYDFTFDIYRRVSGLKHLDM